MPTRMFFLRDDQHPDEDALSVEPRLRRVAELVSRNLSRRVPLAEAAQEAGFEPTYFSKLFHKKVGVPYTQYVAILRVCWAIDFLRDCDDSLSSIARQVGFGDLRTFERNFKRWLKTTPSAFRECCRTQPASPEATGPTSSQFDDLRIAA